MNEVELTKVTYREEAINAFSKRSYGRPIAPMPKSWLLSALMLLVMTGIAIWFLATSSYSRKESAFGWLTPTKGLIRVSESQGGMLVSSLIEQGTKVKKGDTLFVLSQERKLLEGIGEADDLLIKLEQEKSEIQSQINTEEKSTKADIIMTKRSLEQLKQEKFQIQDQIKSQQDRVSLQKEIHDRYASLHDKDQTVSYLELQSQKEQYLVQQQALAALRQRKVTLEREFINTQSRIVMRPLESDRTLSEYRRRLIEIANRETEINSMGGYAIQSPVSGSIATLEVKPGNRIFPQQLLATILPENSELYAEIYIPSRAIGFIEPGQEVRVMYMAFPFQRFGAAEGEIVKVSNTVLMPNEIPVTLGIEEPMYKAHVSLQEQSMNGFGDDFSLRPGMLLQTEIILEKRSFLQWILEPLRAKRSS